MHNLNKPTQLAALLGSHTVRGDWTGAYGVSLQHGHAQSGDTHTQEPLQLDELTFYTRTRALDIKNPIRTAPQNVNSMVSGCYSGEFGGTVHTRCV